MDGNGDGMIQGNGSTGNTEMPRALTKLDGCLREEEKERGKGRKKKKAEEKWEIQAPTPNSLASLSRKVRAVGQLPNAEGKNEDVTLGRMVQQHHCIDLN